MIKMTPYSRSATLLILATLIWAILPGNTPAASSGNAFVDDKTAGGNVLNVMGVLNVGGETAAGAGQIMAIFDICDAVEKANHGEYNDAMAILLKTGITTIFNTTIGPLVTSLDVGKLLRDATVNEVFEPRIQKHYEKYRDLRIADLEAELNDKMVEYTTYDFRRWAEDSRGETVENKGQDTVQDYIKNDLLADGKRNTYLYNIAQMRIQDAKHEKASFAAKWWPRFWTSEKPCSVEDAKNQWINTWNGRVTTEGLQITVDRRKQFAKFWSESSEILIVVDVDNPIEGLTYGIECVELNWREKGAVSQGADGNYVLFVKEIDMKEFSKLRNKYGRNGGLTIQLKAPGRSGKTVASKRILFSELMSAQYANKKKTKNVGMWTLFRVPIRFDWNPELLEQLDLKLNGNAKVDYIGIRIRNTTIALRPKPKSGALRAGELLLEKHFKGGKIDLISVLEASGMPTDKVLECLYGSQDDLFFNFNISCTFHIPDPERDPQRDPPDKMKTYAWQRDLILPEPDTKLDFSFTPQKRPII
ncbi:MAG: hypothetical protein KJ822_19940, partial [Proteobacteria bacterium]|nr:hypothetical protein [Pseudomonadota bacterium]